MKPDQEKFDLLLQIVGHKFGRTPRTPSDFEALADEIHGTIGRTIGLSTLKRLWGYVKDQSGTTYSTLSLLSLYAGYKDWDGFCNFACGKSVEEEDSGFQFGQIVMSSALGIGTRISLGWDNNKACILRKTADPNRFIVESAHNIKLHQGDTTIIDCLAIGRPFYATQCMRDNVALGSYAGAHRGGLKSITLIDASTDTLEL